MADLKYVVFSTALGWVGILGSRDGLLSVALPQRSAGEARQRLGGKINQASDSPRSFRDLINRFEMYFDGHPVSFPDRLDLSGATPFQREVWTVTRSIPYGETRTYAWVAAQTGNQKAARAAGQALGRNHLPIIIPCHRVLSSNGQLGGFSDGLEMKRRLLGLEAQSTPPNSRAR